MQPYCNYVSKNKWIKEKIKQKKQKGQKMVGGFYHEQKRSIGN